MKNSLLFWTRRIKEYQKLQTEKKLARLLYQLMSQLAASNRKILPKVSLIRIEFTYMTRTLETVCNW